MPEGDISSAADGLEAHHISQALRWVNQFPWIDESAEGKAQYLEAFVARQGPLTLATILRLVSVRTPPEVSAQEQIGDIVEPETVEDFDTLFALATIGATKSARARQVLIPYLESPYMQERWIAAIALADMHDARALPALTRMLVEFLPPNAPRDRYGGVIPFYGDFRPSLPWVIWAWGPPGAATALRSGLVAALQAETTIPRPEAPRPLHESEDVDTATAEVWSSYDSRRHALVALQHDLVYGLGRLGAFGALAGLQVPADIYYLGVHYSPKRVVTTAYAAGYAERFRLNLWRVHAAFALLEPSYTQSEACFRFDEVPALRSGVEAALEHYFGLTGAEQREAFRDYDAIGGVYQTTQQIIRYREVQDG